MECEVQIRNTVSGELLDRFTHQGEPQEYCFSPDGRYLLASFLRFREIVVWDVLERRKARVLEGATAPLLVEGGSLLVTRHSQNNSLGEYFKVWDFPALTERHELRLSQEGELHYWVGREIAPDDNLILAFGRDQVWRPFSPGWLPRQVRSGGPQDRLALVNAATGKIEAKFPVPIASDYSYSLSPDGRTYAVETYPRGKNHLHLYDVPPRLAWPMILLGPLVPVAFLLLAARLFRRGAVA
jgi:hypothetical protein